MGILAMNRITVYDPLKTQLDGLAERVEVVDETGRRLGHFVPDLGAMASGETYHRGRAEKDAESFRKWLVGPLSEWCSKEHVPYIPLTMSLRDTCHVKIKWGTHKQGDHSQNARGCFEWKPPDPGFLSITMLVRGAFLVAFRERGGKEATCWTETLTAEGDYVIWPGKLEHKWVALENSLIITVRWPINSQPGKMDDARSQRRLAVDDSILVPGDD